MLLILLACSGPPADDTADVPSILLLSPVDEATVCGSPLLVQTEVHGVVLVEPFTEDPQPGEAHVDVALNGQESLDWMYAGERITMPDIGDGYYQLKVELSGADHTPIEPYAGDLVYITVDATVCE